MGVRRLQFDWRIDKGRHNEREPKGENEAKLLKPLCHTNAYPVCKGVQLKGSGSGSGLLGFVL